VKTDKDLLEVKDVLSVLTSFPFLKFRPSSHDFQKLVDVTVVKVADVSAKDLSRLIWTIGKVRRKLPQETFDSLIDALVSKFSDVRTVDIAQVFVGLKSTNYTMDKMRIQKLVSQLLLMCSDGPHARILSNSIWALSDSIGKELPDYMYKALVDLFANKLKDALPLNVSQVLVGCAHKGHQVDGPSLEKMMELLISSDSDNIVQSIANSTRALGYMNHQLPPGLTQALFDVFLKNLSEANQFAVCQVFVGSQNIKGFEPDLSFSEKLIDRFLSCPPSFFKVPPNKDVIGVAKIIKRLAELEHELPGHMFKSLFSILHNNLEMIELNNVCAILLGVSMVGSEHMEDTLLEALVDRVLEDSETNLQHLTNTVLALGRMSDRVPPAKFQALVDRVSSKDLDAKLLPIHISQVLLGASNRGFDIDGKVLERFLDRLNSFHSSTTTSHLLANSVKALGDMSHRVPQPTIQKLLDSFLLKLTEKKAWEIGISVSQVFVGLAKQHFKLNKATLESLLHHLLSRASELDLQVLSNTLWALGLLKSREGLPENLGPERFQFLLYMYLLKLPEAKTTDISKVLQGVVKMGVNIDVVSLDKLVEKFKEDCQFNYDARRIANTIWSLGCIESTLPDKAQYRHLLDLFLIRLPEAEPHNIVSVLRGLREKDVKIDGPVLEKLVDAYLAYETEPDYDYRRAGEEMLFCLSNMKHNLPEEKLNSLKSY
jgi:hypothetical protein